MLGSGGQARSHLLAYAAVRPIERCNVYSPNPKHREAYAHDMSKTLGIDVVPVRSVQEAVAGADIVACCTNSMIPVLTGDMVEPGVHLTAVSGEWTDEVPEMVDVAARSAETHIFHGAPVDHSLGRGGAAIVYAAANAAELDELVALSGQRYAAEQPKTERRRRKTRQVALVDLINGTAEGRKNDDEVSASTGIGSGGTSGLSFVVVGQLVYQKARESGLGTELPTEMFLQDIRN